MAETRIVNKRFFADNESNARVPVASAVAPDPSGTGQGYSSLSIPSLSRVGHGEDLFVQPGETISVTYRSSVKATLFKIFDWMDATATYSNDGREITVTWTIPADMPGLSTYVGVRAETFGGNSYIEERLHIGKTIADLKYIGVGTDHLLINQGLVDCNPSAGDTIIIANGYYPGFDNRLQFGSTDGRTGLLTFPNGTHTVTQVGTEAIITPIKNTCVMAAKVGGVIHDGEGRNVTGIVLSGSEAVSTGLSEEEVSGSTGSADDGGRLTRCIHVLGLRLRDVVRSDINRSRKNAIRYCTNVSTMTVPNANFTGWSSDGNGLTLISSEDNLIENCLSMSNDRLMTSMYASHKNTLRRIIATQGVMNFTSEHQAQAFVIYGGVKCVFHSCLDLDSAEFLGGSVRYSDNTGTTITRTVESRTPSSGTPEVQLLFTAFRVTRTRNEESEVIGCATMNTISAPFYFHASGDDSGVRDKLHNCSASRIRTNEFNHYPFSDANFPAIGGGSVDVDGVTISNVDAIGISGLSYIDNSFNVPSVLSNTIKNIAFVNSNWDRAQKATDTAFSGTDGLGSVGNLVVVEPPPNIRTSVTGLAASYTALTDAQAVGQGLKYVTRVEPDSALVGLGPCDNIFWTKGAPGSFRNARLSNTTNPEWERVYEDDMNWLNYMPLEVFNEERRLFSCVVQGKTYSGAVGWSRTTSGRPDDYMMTEGTSQNRPKNCPYVVDIIGHVQGTTAVLAWRPMCAQERGEGFYAYDFYVDDALHTASQSHQLSEMRFSDLTSGEHKFQIVCKDSIRGDSGKSEPIRLTV